MKSRALSIILAAIMLLASLSLSGCADKGGEPKATEPASSANGEYGCSSYTELADTAIRFAQTGDAQLIKKLFPPSEIEYQVKRFADKGQDYFELLQQDLDGNAAAYAEKCGEDWKLSYEFTQVNEKDEAGVENYRSFDEFYFKEYGLDPAKIEAVTYIYADVTVAGSSDSVTKQRSMWTFCYEGRWYSFYIARFGLYLIKDQG